MLVFLRTRLFPWLVWSAAAAAAVWIWLGLGRGGAQGFVETAVYSVNAPQTGRVATLHVAVGQHVQTGEVVATLDASDIDAELEVVAGERSRIEAELAAVASNTQVRLSKTNLDVEESIDAAELALEEARAQKRIHGAELAALNKQIGHVRGLVDKRMADRRELVELEVSQAALKKALQQADVLIRQHQRQTGSARARRGDVPEDAVDHAVAPLRAALTVVDAREKVLLARKASLVLRAPGEGEVTMLHLRAGEVVSEGMPIVTLTGPADAWRAGTPTIRVCIDEGEAESITVGEAVELGTPAGVALGRVVGLSPDVAQLPQRCWTDPRVPRWGRSAFVVLDEPTAVVPGQSFTVEFLGHAAEGGAEPIATAPGGSGASPTGSGVTPGAGFAVPTGSGAAPAAGSASLGSGVAAAGSAPKALAVPPALSARSRFEPSGVVWSPTLSRYVVVSDDTGQPKANEHAPWLFTVKPDGTIDPEPLVIKGIRQLRDVEAIAPAPDGVYLMASQGYSRKGKRHRSRTLFVQVALQGRRAQAVAKTSLAAALDAAGDATLRALGLDDTSQLEIEGMAAAADGGLHLGLKSPLSRDGEAIVWTLGDPAAFLRSGHLDDAKLGLWGTVPLAVEADGRPVPGGIAELLTLPDGSLLAAVTASTAKDPRSQTGALVQLTDPATVVATFPGLKPEGLATAHDGDGIVVMFDAGAGQPRWVERPWPAS